LQNQHFYSVHQLSAQVSKLEQRIRELEQSNYRLQQALDMLKKNPPIHVERIDYHFDQLKIERLEGTLNIGINPLDPEQIDEIFVQKQGEKFPVDPKALQRLYERLYQFLDRELPPIIEEEKTAIGLKLDQSYTEFIKQDLLKQLKSQIERQLSKRNANPEPEQEEEIFETIKRDMVQAVRAFLSQFPLKGDD